MPSLEECKLKLVQIIQSFNKKQIITALGVSSFMTVSYFLFKFLRGQRSPAMQYIHAINQNILKSIQNSQKSRQPLVIQQQHTFEHIGITITYTLVSKLKQKLKNNEQLIRNPFLPPFQQGLFIQQLGSSHRLLFNKYNIYQQHILLVTKQFQPQSTPLTKQDFKQSIYTIKALKGLYFFNSGPNAGASQIHKHLQIFPYQARDLPLFRQILQFAKQIKYKNSESKNLNPEQFSIMEYPHFNFKHGIIMISSNEGQSGSDYDRSNEDKKVADLKLNNLIQNTYKSYEILRKHLLNTSEIQAKCDYNLFGCEHFMIMIPRKKEKAFNEIQINAVGFMGSILFKDRNLLTKYVNEDRKAHQILQDITFSKNNNT